jgi:hypothetical protein
LAPTHGVNLEEASPNLSTNERTGFLPPQPIFEPRLQVSTRPKIALESLQG